MFVTVHCFTPKSQKTTLVGNTGIQISVKTLKKKLIQIKINNLH